ncbi:MAG: hypothetical protein JO053_14655 [Acidobacteria bacterium]|nr:hypothetical protein [Acidobacteriota bacterium]
MINAVPAYVSIVFVLTTFAAVAFLIQAIKEAGRLSVPAKLLTILVPFYLFLQAALAQVGFYQDEVNFPPRLLLFGIAPALVTILVYLIFCRRSLLERMSLELLTLVHVVRIPVEVVLLWLSWSQLVPRMMTFEGRNLDVLSGVLALLVWTIVFKFNFRSRTVLIAYNVVGLGLLINIVSIAALSLQSPIQKLNFEQPNVGVLYFPFIWLPTIVVPIVLFAHLVSLWRLIAGREPVR